MGHDYQNITKPDNTYIAISDITPISGNIEDKFTWANTYPNYDTWVELGAREHWCDWYFATAWIDAWDSLTKPSKAYNGVTKSDNSYSLVTTPIATYLGVTK